LRPPRAKYPKPHYLGRLNPIYVDAPDFLYRGRNISGTEPQPKAAAIAFPINIICILNSFMDYVWRIVKDYCPIKIIVNKLSIKGFYNLKI